MTDKPNGRERQKCGQDYQDRRSDDLKDPEAARRLVAHPVDVVVD
jgi:hypothetical protein